MKAGVLQREQVPVLRQVWLADRWYLRLRGLLLRAPLRAGEGLLIVPCNSVHTLGMRYALDLLFLDRAGRVVGWRADVKPWRGAWCRGAHSTLEMPAGSLVQIKPELGQPFDWLPQADAFATPTTERAA